MSNKSTNRARAGFTLVEILVAVAILAILSAALTPLVVKYVNDGRRARAASRPAGPEPTTRTVQSEPRGAIFSGCQPRRHSSLMVGFCVQRIGVPLLSPV